MQHSNRNNIYFEDALIGAYEYKVNNIVNANTFANLNTTQTDRWNYKLSASLIFIGDDWLGCESCQTNTLWISGYVDSITNIGSNEIRFKRIIHNGQQALRVLIISGDAIGVNEDEIRPPRQPNSYPCCNQEFIMIKQ